MTLQVRLDRQFALVEVRHLPPEIKRAVRSALRRLIVDPLGRDPHLDVRRLASREPDVAFFRLRIGDWRLIYTFDAETLYVLRVIHRSEGYGWFDRRDDREREASGS